jgi:hypothetical protein
MIIAVSAAAFHRPSVSLLIAAAATVPPTNQPTLPPPLTTAWETRTSFLNEFKRLRIGTQVIVLKIMANVL